MDAGLNAKPFIYCDKSSGKFINNLSLSTPAKNEEQKQWLEENVYTPFRSVLALTEEEEIASALSISFANLKSKVGFLFESKINQDTDLRIWKPAVGLLHEIAQNFLLTREEFSALFLFLSSLLEVRNIRPFL